MYPDIKAAKAAFEALGWIINLKYGLPYNHLVK